VDEVSRDKNEKKKYGSECRGSRGVNRRRGSPKPGARKRAKEKKQK